MKTKKIKKDDAVIVLTGRDKGRTGKVVQYIGEDRVLVSGVNVVKKHKKGNPQKQIEGGIINQESPIHVSNVAILNPTTKKADRVGFKILQDGKKVRCFKSNNENVDI